MRNNKKQVILDFISCTLTYNGRTVDMSAFRPSLLLLLILSDGKPRTVLMLYRLMRNIQYDEQDIMALKKKAEIYLNKYYRLLLETLHLLEIPVTVQRVGRGGNASYVCKEDGVKIKIFVEPLTYNEKLILNSATAYLDRHAYRDCLELLEGRLHQYGALFKNTGCLYCCYASYKTGDFDAAATYCEQIFEGLLNSNELFFYKSTLGHITSITPAVGRVVHED